MSWIIDIIVGKDYLRAETWPTWRQSSWQPSSSLRAIKLVMHPLLMGVLLVGTACSRSEVAMDARLVWLSSSSRADLEASSSVSVLQSIYGSQVGDRLANYLSMYHQRFFVLIPPVVLENTGAKECVVWAIFALRAGTGRLCLVGLRTNITQGYPEV